MQVSFYRDIASAIKDLLTAVNDAMKRLNSREAKRVRFFNQSIFHKDSNFIFYFSKFICTLWLVFILPFNKASIALICFYKIFQFYY